MNAEQFRGEQIKTHHAVLEGAIDPNAVISGMRLESGSYLVLSRYGDNVWTLSGSLFPAGDTDTKYLNFSRVPVPFQETLRACMALYIIKGIEGRRRPRGSTICKFFDKAVSFLTWLCDKRITRLSEVTPLIAQQYVEFCKGLKNKKGELISGGAKCSRFTAVETLQILSQHGDDPMRLPWPDSSASHLAGLTQPNSPWGQEGRTEIIPDYILGSLFQSAVEWLDQADEIIELLVQVETWMAEGRNKYFIRSRLKELDWTLRDIREAEKYLQTACMIIILITSGIRISELCSLENHCSFKTLDDEGEAFHWMRGTSYKTGAGNCEWLVAKITHQALAVAESLARTVQAQVEKRIADLRTVDPQNPDITHLKGHAQRLFLTVAHNQTKRIGTLTRQTAITHLNAFATQNGIDWHFKTHQFRRTFAVYAAHSAFGDLRYLRNHFKHWSLDMTALYAMSRKQDAELYDTVGLAALDIKTELLEHWLEPDAILTGGAAEQIQTFRNKNEALATKQDRTEMAKSISPLVYLRATGVAWCTADTGGCNGGQGAEKTRCFDCGNAVIDKSHKKIWQSIYAQQIELRNITDIGPGGAERVERDIERCRVVLKSLGASEEDLKNVVLRQQRTDFYKG